VRNLPGSSQALKEKRTASTKRGILEKKDRKMDKEK
jgi:hypothetical protein